MKKQHAKKIIIISILILFVISPKIFAQVTGYSNPVGDGSGVDSPIQISCVNDLIYLSGNSDDWGLFFKQTADIDFGEDETLVDWDNSGTAGDNNDDRGFVPIGSSYPYFSGSYDGDGHIIDHLFIGTGTKVGFFGQIPAGDGDCSISNLGLTNVNITGSEAVGGLIGYNRDTTTISNCYTTGEINSSSQYCGGLVGYSSAGTITNCYSTANLNGGSTCGGIVGISRTVDISGCYSTGTVTGGASCGGIVGKNTEGNISDCHSTGATIGSENCGGVVGYNDEGNVTNCYSTGAVTSTALTYCGGIAGYSSDGNISNCNSSGNVTSNGSYCGGVAGAFMRGQISDSYYSTGTVNGTGSVGGLIGKSYTATISNCTSSGHVNGTSDCIGGLVGENGNSNISNCNSSAIVEGSTSLGDNVGGMVGSNTGGSSYSIENSYSTGSVSGESQTGGFVGYNVGCLIKNSHSTGVVTSTEGDDIGGFIGYSSAETITGCYSEGAISSGGSGNSIGGFIGNSAGTTIDSCSCSGEVSGGYRYLGGFVGYNSCNTISNSHCTGNVTGTYGCIGGFVGFNTGTTINSCYCTGTASCEGGSIGGFVGENDAGASITNCNCSGAVSGDDETGGFAGFNGGHTIDSCSSSGTVSGADKIGGFVGRNEGYIIKNCSSTGEVTGTSNDVGGFAGYNYLGDYSSTTIANSYSTGAVSSSASDNIGGFVGYNYSGVIENCYSTGAVSGDDYTGGLIGRNYNGTSSNCFCLESDLDAVGNTTLDGATEKTAAELKDYVTFTNTETEGLTTAWDFVTNPNDDTGDDNYWDMDQEGIINDGYPILSWQDGADDVLPNYSPTSQPTNLAFSINSSDQIEINYTASVDAESYLLVRGTGSAPTFIPSNGTEYCAGAQGDDYIVYVGSDVSAVDDISSSAHYYYKIYAYNGTGSSTKYLTTDPLSGDVLYNTDGESTISDTGGEPVTSTFPDQDVTINFPDGCSGTKLTATKTTSAPSANFQGNPGVREMKSLYFTITSTNASPGNYTIVLDFSSLENMTEAKWNVFKVMKRADTDAPWKDITGDPHNGTIENRQTDGVWGKFTISGLSSFSEFGGGEPTLLVTDNGDSGDNTLRSILATAGDNDVIEFDVAAMGSNTITLASTITIDKSITLRGLGSDGGVILNGNSSVRVLQIGSSVEDPLYPAVELDNIKITGGNDANDVVGGIYNYGSLTLINCVVAGNSDTDTDGSYGAIGGIYSAGNLTLKNCTVTNNTGSAVDGGIGGIYCEGTFTMQNSILYGNIGVLKNIAGTTINCYNSLFEESINDMENNDYNTVSNNETDGNIFSGNPLFVGSSNSTTHPYSISGSSPCCDAGNNSYCDLTTDIKGDGRKLLYSDGNTTGTIDIGAYEYDYENPLPVELVSFTASVVEEGIQLIWQTATEVNNYGFEIERSVGQTLSLSEEWETIGFIPGHSNSNSPKSYKFVDENPPAGNLEYRLKQIDTDGSYEYYSTTAEISNGLTDVEEEQPTEFSLSQNYPNPFNPTTTIKYSIPDVETSYMTSLRTKLIIYDMLGREVTTLVDEYQKPGNYSVEFNGAGLSSGVYIYKLNAGQYKSVRKMLFAK